MAKSALPFVDRATAPKAEPLAHVRRTAEGEWLTHPLAEHLSAVARLAATFAHPFQAGEWGHLAGLWHDLGKYKTDFQAYICNASGYQADAHLEDIPGKVDHSTAGAIHALQRHPAIGRILAYAIAGHHAGLGDWRKIDSPGRGVEERLRETHHLDLAKQNDIPLEILGAPLPGASPRLESTEYAHLWVRILFSCLVDADFLDTEAFMDPVRAAQRAYGASLESFRDKLASWMAERDARLRIDGSWDTAVNRIRRTVLDDCLAAAATAPGFFSLTVPTGGGKTLSSMAFALTHAIRYGKRRVITAIPYTSIIEQTAQVFAGVFGEDNVLEHHSNLDPDRETPQGRLASQNWDAPIVVTTNVQLFESLFASRTSRCRKLHNLVDSVIILDEAQMLPPEKLMPTLSVLKGLVAHFGCTVVLCTATQPALVGDIGSGMARFRGLERVTEIVRDPTALGRDLRRVEVEIRGPERTDWPGLADELTQHEQVLCIVNRRQDCRDLWTALRATCDEPPVHLSALMCGEHRSRVVARIKSDLSFGRRLRVASTQLVEAGVDIDFPVVYRAMAGLDSIAQAAGRCNREGKLNLSNRLGKVVVFHPPKPSPPGLLLKGEMAGTEVLRTMGEEARNLTPRAFEQYFRTFFSKGNDHGKDKFDRFLVTDGGQFEFQFRSAAAWYQLIDDQGSRGIVVWYDGERTSSRRVIEEVQRFGPSRARMRRLQRCTVNVPERIWKALQEQGSIQEIVGPEGALGVWCQCVPGLYDETFGLRLEGPELTGMEFVC